MSRLDEQIAKIAYHAKLANSKSPVYSTGKPKYPPKKAIYKIDYKRGYGWHLYVLTDLCGKYYVGISTNVERRLLQHSGQAPGGAKWTKKFARIQVCSITPLNTNNEREALHAEDLKTLSMMKRYGVGNVRGGRFCSRKLSQKKVDKLEKRIAKSVTKPELWKFVV